MLRLLCSGARPTAADPATGRTALHCAAAAGHYQIARVLLAAGAALEARERAGLSPAEVAQKAGHNDLAQLLHSEAAAQTHRGAQSPSSFFVFVFS